MLIKWPHDYIPETIEPSPTQLAFTMLPHMEALFGGAAGGGKSVILLANGLQYVDVPGYAALILRRSLTELKQPGALLDLARQWLGNTNARYLADEHTYEFPTQWPDGRPAPPAKLQFGYLGDHQAEIRYQGAAYQYIAIDELTHFENDSAYLYLFSRLRKNVCPIHKLAKNAEGVMAPNYVEDCDVCRMYENLPVRFRAATNPGGPGHAWVKNRFQIHSQVVKSQETGETYIDWVGGDKNRPFIPSKILDNLFLDQQSYTQSLQNLDELRRQQLEEGDWDASPDSRFNSKWIKFYKCRGDYFQLGSSTFHLDDFREIFITVDPAASTSEGPIDVDVNPKKGPSYTVISVWGLTPDFHLCWLHMKRFREEIPFVIDEIQDSYKRFKAKYVAVETNGLGIGPAQILASRGVQISSTRKTKDKIQNAGDAIYRMKNGRVWLPEIAPWLKVCTDELFTWTGHPGVTDDIVDTLSDACNIVTELGRGNDPILAPIKSVNMPSSSPMVVELPNTHLATRRF